VLSFLEDIIVKQQSQIVLIVPYCLSAEKGKNECAKLKKRLEANSNSCQSLFLTNRCCYFRFSYCSHYFHSHYCYHHFRLYFLLYLPSLRLNYFHHLLRPCYYLHSLCFYVLLH